MRCGAGDVGDAEVGADAPSHLAPVGVHLVVGLVVGVPADVVRGHSIDGLSIRAGGEGVQPPLELAPHGCVGKLDGTHSPDARTAADPMASGKRGPVPVDDPRGGERGPESVDRQTGPG